MATLSKTVGLLLDDPQNQYQQLLVKEAQLWAPRCDLALLEPQFAGGSSWTQLESIQAWLRQSTRPEGLMVMLAGSQMTASTFSRVLRAGTSIVFLNRIPTWADELRSEFPDALVASVAPRQEGIGEVQGQHAIGLARTGAFVLLVTGEAKSQAAIDRQRGFERLVGSRFDVHALEGRWSSEGAAQAMADWFRVGARRQTPIDLIVCQNDTMAAGVRRALADQARATGRQDLEHVPLVGCDGLQQEGRAMVSRGELAATVVLPATTPPALQLLRRFWDSGAQSRTVLLEGTPFPALDQAAS
ncbi:MAG TPA: substrate-binding domain-containing protein [Vicinamibacteria bacterium]|nr:substrate-binding domain-containing protein [Vicinamibacteria bacterium]